MTASIRPTTMRSFPDSRSGSMGLLYDKRRAAGADVSVRQATGRAAGSDQFVTGKKVADFEGCRSRRVGAVGAIVLNAGAEVAADGAGRSLGGIGSAHGVAPFRDGVFRFQYHDHGLAGTHEGGQLGEKRALAVHGVEPFGFAAA